MTNEEAGLVRVEVWVRLEHKAEIIALADDLNNPPTITPETLAAIRRNAARAAAAQSKAAAEQLAVIGVPRAALEDAADDLVYRWPLTNPKP